MSRLALALVPSSVLSRAPAFYTPSLDATPALDTALPAQSAFDSVLCEHLVDVLEYVQWWATTHRIANHELNHRSILDLCLSISFQQRQRYPSAMATAHKKFAVDYEFDVSKIDVLWSGTWEEAPAWNVKDSKYTLCLPVPVKTVRDWNTSVSGESRLEHVIVWQMDLQEILSDGKVYHVGYVRQKYGFRDPNPTLEFGMGATAVKPSAMTSDEDPTLALHPPAPPSSPIATPPAKAAPVPMPRVSRKRSYHIDPDDSDDEQEVRARKRRIAAGTSTVSDDIADVYFEAKQHEPFIRIEDCGMVTYKVRRKCKKIPSPPTGARMPTVTPRLRCDVLEYIPIRAELVCK